MDEHHSNGGRGPRSSGGSASGSSSDTGGSSRETPSTRRASARFEPQRRTGTDDSDAASHSGTNGAGRGGRPVGGGEVTSKLPGVPASVVTSFCPASLAEPDEDGHVRRFNRDLQWLAFNERVLYQAEDERLPLLERVRFLSIFSSNLDEFFMKRVGGLRRQVEAGITQVAHERMSPSMLLRSLRERIVPLTARKADCYRNTIIPALQEIGIELVKYDELTETERLDVRAWFRRDVFPILTPLAVDPGHRFPFISNLSVSLGVLLRRPDDHRQLFARVKIPDSVPQWYRIGNSHRFCSLQEILIANLRDLFPGMEILAALAFRVTRNADVEGDDADAEDLLEQIQAQLRERRFAPVVRLQVQADPHPGILEFLCDAMEVRPEEIYETTGLIDYGSLSTIADLNFDQHRFKQWTPVTPPRLRNDEQDIFSIIRDGDVLVHHPYDSFDDSATRFIERAAMDPNVLCIKQALYRTAGDSAFVQALIRAAERGKQVAVLVELRARFDEARNIEWARRLEEAGVHVAYGVVGLKTHTKIALVVRRESEAIRSYVHIGTGNYHSTTARLYDDIGLLTADPMIAGDVIDLFNFMTGRSRQKRYDRLLVAPYSMKQPFLDLIAYERDLARAGGQGRIIAKMNQLQDNDIIEALYEASNAGVRIDLIIRGFCTLVPGVPGMSENIRVVSVIGRFLEHSRIFWFGRGEADPHDGVFMIGSADWMYRNLHNRVEAIAPIERREFRVRLWTILQTLLHDQRQAWDLNSDGTYSLRSPGEDGYESAHDAFMRMAIERVQGPHRQS